MATRRQSSKQRGKAPSVAQLQVAAAELLAGDSDAHLVTAARQLGDNVVVQSKAARGFIDLVQAMEADSSVLEMIRKGATAKHADLGGTLRGVPLVLAAVLHPARAAPIAAAVLGNDQAHATYVGRAALALERAIGTEAAPALWRALRPRIQNTDDTRAELVDALSRSATPEICDQVLAALEKLVGRAPKFRTADKAAGAEALMAILAARDFEPAVPLLAAIKETAKDYEMRVLASASLSRFTSKTALEPLAAEWETAPEVFNGHAIDAVMRLDPVRAYDVLEPALRDEALTDYAGIQLANAVIQSLTNDLLGFAAPRHNAMRDDPRWLVRCRELLPSSVGFAALPALAALGTVEAAAAILDHVDAHDIEVVATALASVDGPERRQVAALIERRAKKLDEQRRARLAKVADELAST